MDSSNNKVDNILDTKNWSDNLLVKDEKGNLGYLKKKNKSNLSTQNDNKKTVSSAVSEGSPAPKDDNFAQIENVTGNSQDKADFVFHPDDKEELDFFAKQIPQDDSKKYSVEKIVSRIIEKQNLDLDDKNKKIFTNILYNFFRNRKKVIVVRELLSKNVLIKNKKLSSEIVDTVLSIIKTIKNKIDAEGGLVVNRAELKAQQDLLLLKEKKDKDKEKTTEIKEKEKPEESQKSKEAEKEGSVEEKKPISAQEEISQALGQMYDTSQDIGKEIEESKDRKEEALEPEPSTDIKTPEKKPEPVKEEKKPDAPKPEFKPLPKSQAIQKKPSEGFAIPSDDKSIEEGEKPEPSTDIKTPEKKPEPVKEEKKPEPVKEKEQVDQNDSLPKVSRPSVNQAPKKAVSDVVTPVKSEQSQAAPLPPKSVLTGPVQELQSFDLVGFRRLGESAEQRVDKILDKIELLEQESYTKKAQGIAAWRDSGVYKLYLQIGAESMMAGKEVADYIEEMKNKNQDILTIEEFNAISDLNKKMRF